MLEWIDNHIVSTIVFLPLVGSLTLLICKTTKHARVVAMATAVLNFMATLYIWIDFDSSTAKLQFVEAYQWIPALGIKYIVGIDGLNLLLLLLTAFITPLVLLSLWSKQVTYPKVYLSLILSLECGMMGSLVAFDMIFFYVFWELMLIPMYFMIGIWGGANRIFATTKFFIYTVFGSLLMLLAALSLYLQHFQEFGYYSTSLLDLYRISELSITKQQLLFAAFALAFAIKVPIWPFHTWLPLAHTEAPTAGSVLLAGVLLKMGTYGFLRFAIPLFPDSVSLFSPIIMGLGVIGIIYGAIMAWMQSDAKKMVAYSSVSHLGFVVMGSMAIFGANMSQEALTGAVYQMINHGMSTGALFFLVGVIYERRHTRVLGDFGGIAGVMPWFAILLIVATLGSVGLPGTGGFIGEFLILLGIFQHNMALAILASLGILLGAIYMLKLCLHILFGPLDKEENKSLNDLTQLEFCCIAPLAILIIVMGIFPDLFLSRTQASIQHLSSDFKHYRLMVSEQSLKKNRYALQTHHDPNTSQYVFEE